MKVSDLEFKPHPAELGGAQAIVKFNNGYGASVITGWQFYTDKDHSYELAVLGKDGKLDYTTPITNDVCGHLNEEDVNELLLKIENL